MAYHPIVAPSVKELFIQQIEGMILSGELRPGDSLPPERELAEEMKISKTVVHEGIRELHRLGFLDVASRRGVTVADYAQTGTAETLLAVMRYHGGHLDPKTASSLLDVRLYIECPAFEALAARRTPKDVEKLEELERQATRAAKEGPDPFAEALFRYHRAVAFLSGNSLTPLIMNAFSPISLVVWRRYIQVYGTDACLVTLSRFTQAVREGNGKGAADILRDGVEDFIRRADTLI